MKTILSRVQIAAVCAALTLLAACDTAGPPENHASAKQSGNQPVDYFSLRESFDNNLQQWQLKLEQTAANNATTPARTLFNGWLQHARLTGDLNSYQHAGETLAVLKQRSKHGSPCYEIAQLALATHQPAMAETALQGCKAGLSTNGLQAKIALYQGRYHEALDLAASNLNAGANPDAYYVMSVMRLHTGSPHEATALLEAAEQRYHDSNPHQQAWYKLQRGIHAMSSGQFERARALFRHALKIMPNWWLAEEHLAEVSVYLGDTETAMQLYDKVIAATGYAEFLTARADLLMQAGNSEAATADLEAARAQFDQRLQLYPEAVAGHAVDFYLQHGPADKALELAQADYQRRPYGEAATSLAEALLQHDRAQDAVELLRQHIDAGWHTVDTHYVLASAYHALGQEAASKQQQQLVWSLNPGFAVMLGDIGS